MLYFVGIAVLAASYHSIFAAAGARPDPFNATGLRPDGAYKQKQSPPIPVDCGSTTHNTAAAATAASRALPPERSTSSAVSVATGIDVAAIPCVEITGLRPG